MAVLTSIAGVPLFTTTQEALSWAAGNGCSGYHTHNYQGQSGFMGCANHLQASGMPLNSNTPPPTTFSGGGSGGTSGGGGGGGY